VFGLAIVATASLSAADAPAAATPWSGLRRRSASRATRAPTKLEDFRGAGRPLLHPGLHQRLHAQAHNFQEDLAKYTAANAVILGVSVDSADSHKSFCAKEGLNFRLLSDPDASVSTAYGSVMEYEGKKPSARNTCLIDPAGKIVKVYTGVKPATHSGEVLEALASLAKK
jgi:peroxiredoxin Q/BCP